MLTYFNLPRNCRLALMACSFLKWEHPDDELIVARSHTPYATTVSEIGVKNSEAAGMGRGWKV